MLSVIVPVYNIRPYLERCVESIVAQTYHNLEIILVDDGSTDGSGDLCDALSRRDARIHVVHKANGGLSSARNAGMDVCLGDYIGFVDGDDYIAPEMYETLMYDLTHYDADIAHCGCEIVKSTGSQLRNGTGDAHEWNRNESLVQHLTGVLIEPSVCCKLYKRQIVDKLRFDESVRLSEDIPFNYFAFKRAKKTIFHDVCLYKYVKRDGSLTNGSFSSKRVDTIATARMIAEDIEKTIPELSGYGLRLLCSTEISVYNHSLYSNENYSKLRRQIKEELRRRLPQALQCKAFSLEQKVAVVLLTQCEPGYRLLERLRRYVRNRRN